MNYSRNIYREFSNLVRKQEKINAQYQCRICGLTKKSEPLQLAHIYTLSESPFWKRTGTQDFKWKQNDFVNSYDNALLLCKSHHDRIDSKLGLQKCSVQYLQSLKSDLTHCTALDKSWHRCHHHRAPNSHRCTHHHQGGLEQTLPFRTYNPSTGKCYDKPSTKAQCIIV